MRVRLVDREVLRRCAPAIGFAAAWLAMGTVLIALLSLVGNAVLR